MQSFLNRNNVIGLFLLSSFIVVVSFQNCAKLDIKNLDSTSKAVGDLGDEPTETPIGPSDSSTSVAIKETPGFICSAFGTNTGATARSGLKAELRFLDQGAPLTTLQKNSILATQYFNDQDSKFIKAPESVFLNDVNVPTRIFNLGFEGSDGKILKDNNGQALIEYFALKMESVLKLTDGNAEGYYELASIADDGSVVQIKEEGKWITLIDNDGAHSTRMGCMNRKLFLNKDSRIPIRIIYNQGPREQIANVLVWNYRGPAESTSSLVSTDLAIHNYCGKAHTTDYWSSSTNRAGPWFNDLTSKGWKVLASGNFQLPDNEVNPCAYSSYDVNPVVTYSSISNNNKMITIKSSDSAVMKVSLYLIQNDGSKELVQSKVLAEALTHDFETGNLMVGQKYLLEVVMELPAKNLKVLKSYEIQLSLL